MSSTTMASAVALCSAAVVRRAAPPRGCLRPRRNKGRRPAASLAQQAERTGRATRSGSEAPSHGHVGPPGARIAALAAAAAVAIAAAASTTSPLAARAFGPVRITLDGLQVEKATCPPGTRAFGGYSQTRCLNVSAKANNPSGKTLYNVDVFGRVYDSQGSNALDRDEASDAGRITNIPKVEAGETTVQFPLRVSEVQARTGELQLKNFKATGFPGASFTPLLDECSEELGELGLGGECADPEDQVPF